MNTVGIFVSCLALGAATLACAKEPRCTAVPVDLGRLGDKVALFRVFTGADGKSHSETVSWEAVKTTYLGLQLAHFDFGDPSNVVIVRGPPNFDIPFHPAPYREIFIVLSGGSTSVLSDGTKLELKPGSVLLFEDVSGPGHGGKVGPCGYVALDLQFKPVLTAPAAVVATPTAR